MYATIPVYKYSLTDAVNYKERELWLESYNINMECKRAIEERAATAFNTRELDLLIEDFFWDHIVLFMELEDFCVICY